MVFLSPIEIVDIVIMSLVIGFIFKDIVRPRVRYTKPEDLIKNITPKKGLKNLKLGKLSDFWYAVLLVAPAIIFHEFGHKFVAIYFGLSATFHAAYKWLAFGLVLKLIAPGFVFFVPAFVSYPEIATAGQSTLIAFAGPAVNGLFWLGSFYAMKFIKMAPDKLRYVALFRRINGFLFIFNMIPIGPFDGAKVLAGLARLAGVLF